MLIERLTDESSAAHLARRILKAFDAPFVVAGREVFASASISVALGSGGARSTDVLRDACRLLWPRTWRYRLGIGDWVLDEACRQMRAWRDAHPATSELSVSVNVAAQQLVLPTFAESVLRACERSGFPAPRLNVEITESAILKDVATVRENLAAMRAAGVRVHLDDFGTGYSSLSQINTLAIDVLKIDRSFVSGAGPDIANVEIVRTILALAQHLNIDVTAEGIETVEQRDRLVALDCPFGQGYLFSRPVDAARATELIAELDVVVQR